MHLASRLVQNDHTDRACRPLHPLDKCYRGGGFPRVGVHFSNDRPRSVEELDAELHRQRPRRRSTSASESRSVLSVRRRRIAFHQHPGRGIEADRVARSLGHYQRDAPPVSGCAASMHRPVGQDHVTFASASLPIGRAAIVTYQRPRVGIDQPGSFSASPKPKDNLAHPNSREKKFERPNVRWACLCKMRIPACRRRQSDAAAISSITDEAKSREAEQHHRPSRGLGGRVQTA
jgi:hypothetical protein